MQEYVQHCVFDTNIAALGHHGSCGWVAPSMTFRGAIPPEGRLESVGRVPTFVRVSTWGKASLLQDAHPPITAPLLFLAEDANTLIEARTLIHCTETTNEKLTHIRTHINLMYLLHQQIFHFFK